MRAGSAGGVRAVVRPAAVVVPLSGSGTQTIAVPAAGRYGVWLAGSVRNRLQIAVDGRALPAVRHHLDHAGYYVPLGEIDLGRGAHEVAVEYERGGLRPGSGGVEFPFGPLVLSTTTADAPMTTVSAAQAPALCGKRLDWIEAVGEAS
jgi:hypothetical protein